MAALGFKKSKLIIWGAAVPGCRLCSLILRGRVQGLEFCGLCKMPRWASARIAKLALILAQP